MKIKMTPDKRLAKRIKKAIEENGGHCPLQIPATPDTLCLCKEFMDAFNRKELCECRCGLYYTEE